MNRYDTSCDTRAGNNGVTPFIAEVMQSSGLAGGHYAEPYAGGAGVAIQLLLGGVADPRISERSQQGSVFLLAGNTDPDRGVLPANFDGVIDRQRVAAAEGDSSHRDHGQLDLAFSLFFLKPLQQISGIPSGGVIGGLQQAGPWKIDARFPRVELIRRVEAISQRGNRRFRSAT